MKISTCSKCGKEWGFPSQYTDTSIKLCRECLEHSHRPRWLARLIQWVRKVVK